jgi:Helix-turn-helix domain
MLTPGKATEIRSKKRRGRPPGRRELGSEITEIMTIQEVAEFLKCHPTTIYRLLKTRGIEDSRG